MPVHQIHTYLVHPGKGSDGARHINGTAVPLRERLFELLDSIYARSDDECDIDIIFKPTAGGVPQNDCRDLICTYISDPTLASGRAIAQRLENHTDNRSGLGLLFLIVGKEGHDHKLVISRFPTDTAILVDENPRTLDVSFLERVFLKNRTSYKAAMYRDASLRAGLWSGKVIDKQIGPAGESSDYWIADFLLSVFKVTPAQGTRRLGTALRKALAHGDLDVKEEIIAAARLAGRLGRETMSINDFERRFNLSQAAKDAIARELKNPRLAEERFQFVASEFNSLVAYRSKELNNGAMLTAPAASFDDVFHEETIDSAAHTVKFTTQGTVVNDRLKPKA